MTIKQVLDGVELLRTIANHPTMTSDEKIAAIKTSVETVRNDVQDLSDSIYKDYAGVEESDALPEQVEALYQRLREQDFSDLVFFYKKSVFADIDEANARKVLAQILLRIAAEKEAAAPQIWLDISGAAGNINEG